jgi:stearoyl-CoA desaturase (Delta-9 desaturase)
MTPIPPDPDRLETPLPPSYLPDAARGPVGFFAVHLLLLAYLFNVKSHPVGTLIVWFLLQFGIHAGYHRYFSHRSFRTYPWFEFCLGILGALAIQNGPIWWASKHRHHHQHTDLELDHHSPSKGILHAHMTWLWLPGAEKTELELVRDIKTPIPTWIEGNHRLIIFVYVLVLCVTNGLSGLIGYWALPVVLCWHTTFATNSLCHTRSSAAGVSEWTAVNRPLVAFLNLGEGWHANHHSRPGIAHHGWYLWYQIDVTYSILFILERIGVIFDLRRASKS